MNYRSPVVKWTLAICTRDDGCVLQLLLRSVRTSKLVGTVWYPQPTCLINPAEKQIVVQDNDAPSSEHRKIPQAWLHLHPLSLSLTKMPHWSLSNPWGRRAETVNGLPEPEEEPCPHSQEARSSKKHKTPLTSQKSSGVSGLALSETSERPLFSVSQ